MIDRRRLLADLQKLLRVLEADLLERSGSTEVAVAAALQAEYDRARAAGRTAASFEEWRTDAITQAAVAWVLSAVFARFLEDNELVHPPRIAGPGPQLERARDEFELYVRGAAAPNEREYLFQTFESLAKLPGGREIFGDHNPLREYPTWLSGDAGRAVLEFFQKKDSETGLLLHDFTDPAWDTRFLGDLYQDLSEATRKKYALLQTPEFVEEFILDHTLEPALDEFGLEQVLAAPAQKKLPGLDDRDSLRTPFKMIDPACGSGHFLLGVFPRILARWLKQEPGALIRDLVGRTLKSIHGVDVNPYAVAITRFRLLLAAMRASGETRLADAPAFALQVACGDSLLHAPLIGGQQVLDFELTSDDEECDHAYQSEDLPLLKAMLRAGTYHAVVANPPYITPKDRQLNERYRRRFTSCHMKYSLSVPFLERIFKLAVKGGFTGQITSNSFMKREFGRKLIEEFFPTVDLTHVIDTAGAYIPGHGTPTTILFGRHQLPVASTLRTVMGIRGEPATPQDPSRGLVWSAIVHQLNHGGSKSEFVSVGDSPRELFHKHPWSIGGGGAAELKDELDGSTNVKLSAVIDEVGIIGMTNADEIMLASRSSFARKRVESVALRKLAMGDQVRDWQIQSGDLSLFPYQEGSLLELRTIPGVERWLWSCRSILGNRVTFSRLTYFQEGRPWWEWHQVSLDRLHTPMTIVFAEVATHNHFVLDRGGKVYNRTAPIIKLSREATEDDYLALVGLLNSSTTCFWMKQVAHQKQMMGGDGIRIDSKAKVPYAFSGTQLAKLPIPSTWKSGPFHERLLGLARRMDQIASRLSEISASIAVESGLGSVAAIRETWHRFEIERKRIRSQMIWLQEEIDFSVYAMWELTDESLLSKECDFPEVSLDGGDRPFDILRGKNEDGFPVPDGLQGVPSSVRELWKCRIEAFQHSSALRLIEDPHYKRRWIGRQGLFNHSRNRDELQSACGSWLLDRLESYLDFDGRMVPADEPKPEDGKVETSAASTVARGSGGPEPSHGPAPSGDINATSKTSSRASRGKKEEVPEPRVPTYGRGSLEIALFSVARLADVARGDAEFMQVGELYRDDPAFDVQKLVAELVAAESVPLLPVLRYKPSGLIKRGTWERTWTLQRQEDAIDARSTLPESDPAWLSLAAAKALKQQEVGDIPVPAKYISADFLNGDFWRLRGKLDVPKERWVSFPHCEGPDETLVIAWAGYDHLQLAQAISGYFVRVQTEFGGTGDPRLIPLLSALLELLPWIHQWHNDIHPEYNQRLGEVFEAFVNEEARTLGLTLDEIREWKPPARVKKAAAKKAKKTPVADPGADVSLK